MRAFISLAVASLVDAVTSTSRTGCSFARCCTELHPDNLTQLPSVTSSSEHRPRSLAQPYNYYS